MASSSTRGVVEVSSDPLGGAVGDDSLFSAGCCVGSPSSGTSESDTCSSAVELPVDASESIRGIGVFCSTRRDSVFFFQADDLPDFRGSAGSFDLSSTVFRGFMVELRLRSFDPLVGDCPSGDILGMEGLSGVSIFFGVPNPKSENSSNDLVI